MTEVQASKSRLVAKNTMFLFLRMFVVTIIGLYTSRVVLDVLGINDFGLYNVVGGIVVLFSFLQQALNNATYRFMAYAIGEGEYLKQVETYSMSINVHLLLSLVLLLLAEIVGVPILNYVAVIPEGRQMAANIAYQFSILSFCAAVIKTPFNSSIIAHESMNFFALTSVIEVIFKLAVVYVLLATSVDKLVLYSILLFGIDVLLLLWYYRYCKSSFSECVYKRKWDSALAKKLVRYSGWSVVVNASDVLVTQSIVLFFNLFCGVVANAALGIANQVTGKVTMLLGSFSQAFNPQIIKSYASNDRAYFMNLIFSTSKMSYYLMLLICVPLLLNIDFILGVWLKEVPRDTSVFVFYTIMYSLIDAYSAPLWIAVHATGNLKNHQLLMSGIKLMNIPLAYIMLTLGYGAWTALAIKAFLNLVCSIARPIYMKRLIGLNLMAYSASVFFPMIIVTLISLPIIYYIIPSGTTGFVKLLVSTLLSAFVLSFTVLLLGINKVERSILIKMLHIENIAICRKMLK